MRGDSWHYLHMLNPRDINPQSRMPNYPWLFEKKTDFKSLPARIAVQQRIGVPYPIMTPEEIEQGAREQALRIATGLVGEKVRIPIREGEKEPANETEARDHLADKQIIAIIAYLQKLGSYDVVAPPGKPEPTKPRTIKPGIPDQFRKTNPPAPVLPDEALAPAPAAASQ